MPTLKDKEIESATQIMLAYINRMSDPRLLFENAPSESRSFESIWNRIANAVSSREQEVQPHG